jgi:hypothetical protein
VHVLCAVFIHQLPLYLAGGRIFAYLFKGYWLVRETSGLATITFLHLSLRFRCFRLN